MYLARQAVLIAAEGLEAGDVSPSRLAAYDDFVRSSVISSLEAEQQLILGVLHMADEQIDRVCETMHQLRLVTPFFATWRTAAWEAIGWFVKQFPLVARDWNLLQEVFKGPEGKRLVTELEMSGSDGGMASRRFVHLNEDLRA